MSEETPSNDSKNHNKRNIWLVILSCIFLLAGLLWFFYWLLDGRFHVRTEDAYIHGNQVVLTPQVSAGVAAIYADDTDLVEAGQLVVSLDTADYEIQVSEWKERLANAVRDVSGLFQDVKAKKAQVVLRAAQLNQSKLDLKHRQPLAGTGAISEEEFENYETAVIVAEAQLESAIKDLEATEALVAGTTVRTHPKVEEAVWNLRQAYLDLIRCQIWAPVTGYIGKRSVQVGDQVKVGQTLLFIVPLNDLWINANYKETQLSKVRTGQPVEYTADIYGGSVKFHGKVVGFQPGSGSAFSLLPPENASGNWIKIIQRVPVRISISPEELRQHPLLLGLSMRVKIDVRHTDEEMLTTQPTDAPIYTTSIYAKQMEDLNGYDEMIEEIIEKNDTSEWQ